MEALYDRFKHLIEYFVAHLEYVQTSSKQVRGYDFYIKPLEDNKQFKWSGQGWNGGAIQKQISDWEDYDGYKIYISISNHPTLGYASRSCYLNWHSTWLNIRPDWGDKKTHITNLYISTEEGAGNAQSLLSYSLDELGLFDNQPPGECVKKMFDTYYSLIKKEEGKRSMQPYVNFLKVNKNIILTGAPGTGKTYLAKQIAEELGANDENQQCVMVQFHPSYDYTDFVEGLRPIQSEGDTTIGFELKRGVFKEFCARALANLQDSQKPSKEIGDDNKLQSAYKKLIGDIEQGLVTEIPLKSGSAKMDIVEISNNENIILKTQDPTSTKRYTVSYNRLRKLSLFYKDTETLDSITNIYEAVTSAIKGCHSSAYWAALHYLYEKYWTPQVDAPQVGVERKNYVFIIDEINRGEISKIFGELFFSIDPGYRGKEGLVKTQYQNLIEPGDVFDDGFYVPENVYIIGTMNDIDRSVDSMDFAMRRRFAWQEIKSTDRIAMLDDLGKYKDEAVRKMNALNLAIEEVFNTSYHIGPAYFKKASSYKDSENTMWDSLWNYHIKGLLYEYVRGTENAKEKMNEFEQAYRNA